MKPSYGDCFARPPRFVAGKLAMTALASMAFLFILAPDLFAWSVQERTDFQKANQSYQQGHYPDAIARYESLAHQHPEAVFYYNLGNSYFKAGKIGPAILAFERARAMKPGDPDIRRNLNYVRGLLEYRIEDKRNWYLRAAEKFLNGFTSQEIQFLWVLSYFLFIASWALVLFFQRGAPWGWRRKTLLVLLMICTALALGKHLQKNRARDAIVMNKETEVRYGPSDSDAVAFRLGEGLKVYVVDRRSDWSRILATNGETGWVRNSEIAEVGLP